MISSRHFMAIACGGALHGLVASVALAQAPSGDFGRRKAQEGQTERLAAPPSPAPLPYRTASRATGSRRSSGGHCFEIGTIEVEGVKQFSAGAGQFGVFANGSGGQGSGSQNTITHVNTHVAGAGDLTLRSGNDTNLKGAVVSGEAVRADVGGDLNIESQVDTATSKGKQASAGLTVSSPGGIGASGTIQNAEGDAAVVSEQSGIHAGGGGFDIKVGGATSLTGGLITSTAPAGENRLETGTLHWEDIDTHSRWKADTYGGSIGSGGVGMAPPLKEGESATGKALSAISPAEIVITDPARQQQDVGGLRRDTTGTNTSLPGLPDLQAKLREQYKTQQRYQEAAALMAQAVARIADRLRDEALARGDAEAAALWGTGGLGRAALHALGGGILGGVTDVSGMVKAAFGGAVSTLIAPYVHTLVQDIVNDAGLGGTAAGQALANIVSGGIVMGLTATVGGGDAAAYAGAEFQKNYLKHQQILDFDREMKACGTDVACQLRVVEKYQNLSADNEDAFTACTTMECRALHLAAIDEARSLQWILTVALNEAHEECGTDQACVDRVAKERFGSARWSQEARSILAGLVLGRAAVGGGFASEPSSAQILLGKGGAAKGGAIGSKAAGIDRYAIAEARSDDCISESMPTSAGSYEEVPGGNLHGSMKVRA